MSNQKMSINQPQSRILLFSIGNKIAFCFLVPLILMIIIGFTAYQKATAGMSQKFEESTLQTLKMATEYVDMGCKFIESEGRKYVSDNDLGKYYLGLSGDDYNLISNIKNDFLSSQTTNPFISNIHIVTPKGINMLSTKTTPTMDGCFETYKESVLVDKNTIEKWVDIHPELDNSFALSENNYILAFEMMFRSNNACIVIDIDPAVMEWMEEFDRKVIVAAHRSADIEIVPLKLSFGGNAPILSNALAHLGYKTACIGNMDNIQGEDPFNKMHPLCERISIGQTNRTIALEFTDGKIMLGNLYGNFIGWEEIKQKVGILRFRELVQESRLIGMVNWSGMLRMNDMISGFYEEFLLPLEKEQKANKDIFMDLADPSARSEEDLQELYDLIRLMASTIRLSLGMNENEVKKIGKGMGMGEDDIVKCAEAIRSELGVYQIVVHTHDFIVGCRMGQWERIENKHIAVPVQSTGAGDHFNAGFCMGILEKKSLIECMRLGQAMGYQYVSTGMTSDREQLLREY